LHQATPREKEESKGGTPQRAGDCLAGVVTNEMPSGKPQTV